MSKDVEGSVKRIVLISDNKDRELGYLKLLKSKILKKCDAKVWIIGSVANKEKTKFLLYRIKPQIVLMSQVAEDNMREVAWYVKKSGALLFVLPAEITVIPALSSLIVSKKVQYDELVDGIFVPGRKILNLYSHAAINKKKLFLTGSPKIDLLMKGSSELFLSKKDFLNIHKIPIGKKNIFVFTSFITIPVEYLEQNHSFRGKEKTIISNNKYIQESELRFINAIESLCAEFPDCNIILKAHPLEDLRKYANISRNNFYLLPKMSLYNCLKSIDLCLHWSSTVATECWIKQVPTIQFVPIKRKGGISEFQYGNPVVFSSKELARIVRKYLRTNLESKFVEFQNEFLSENYYKLDGKASDRIAQQLAVLMKINNYALSYEQSFDKRIYLVLLLEMMIGFKLANLILSFFLKNYNWRYAVENYVFDS